MEAIIVNGIGKAYKKYSGKWARAFEWVTGKVRHAKSWVLRDISFTVAAGEAVGIVGVNGAGKSTLLKIITGTTMPSTGNIILNGRVAALLELGMGFHDDFTGRQNVYISGQLLGLRSFEIDRCMPAIEAFSEIGEYIDRPVRMYSSGMKMRLAFSVATAVRPDVLIIDEALSVGDAYFQHKSFGRIRNFREQGTTLLFVSHDKAAVQALCDRVILLEGGFLVKDGNPQEVMDFYNAIIADKETSTVQIERLADGRAQTISGTGEASVDSCVLLNESGDILEVINVGQKVRLQVEIRIGADLPTLTFGYMIKDRLGQPVFGTNTHHLGFDFGQLRCGSRFTLLFSFPLNVGIGSYSISTALHVADTHLIANYEWRDLVCLFNVINLNRDEFVGVSWIPPKLIVK